MAFEATKREWSEIYAFFRLLTDASISGKQIAMIYREEHDGPRRYYIENSNIRIEGEKVTKSIPREDFGAAANLILSGLKASADDLIMSSDEVEAFLDEAEIFHLEAQTNDRTDLSIAFWHPEAPLVGFNIRSRLSKMYPLLDGGRSANLKFELTGVKFAVPTVNKVNALETPQEVADRMMLIERLGGILKYSDVADRVFRGNLLMIDLHFPRLLAEMLRIMHLDNITKVNELTEVMKKMNPLKIKDDLIQKHGFYEFKMKQFLTALALGMRPAKIYNGADSMVEGIILVQGNGTLQCYHKSEKEIFEDFLFANTRFEKGDTNKDKYGFLERENGVWYFKLNAKIGITKR